MPHLAEQRGGAVSTGLLCTAVDLRPEARDLLHAADVVARLD